MSLRDYLRELAFPVTSATTVIALLTFAVLIRLAVAAGLLGLWLAVVTVPAVLRYMTTIAEARVEGVDTTTPGIETFSIVGQWWTLFPIVPVTALAYVVWIAQGAADGIPAVLAALGLVAILPALIGVLVLTHSPLASLDPRAITHFIRGCGPSYGYALVTTALVVVLALVPDLLPAWVLVLVEAYLVAACFAVIGGVSRDAGLTGQIDIPDAVEPDVDSVHESMARNRSRVLDHAYGLASRGNRDGALAHVRDGLANDPDPDSAWQWFVEQMLRWEDSYPGLLLAQQYLERLLALDCHVAAVKLMLRCRLLDERFRPLPSDLSAAIEAARSCDNDELVAALSDRRS